jgi:hypothetical protein
MEIKEIKKIIFKKGDIFVIRVSEILKKDAIDHMKESVDFALERAGLHKGDVTILIFDIDSKFEIWRKNE